MNEFIFFKGNEIVGRVPKDKPETEGLSHEGRLKLAEDNGISEFDHYAIHMDEFNGMYGDDVCGWGLMCPIPITVMISPFRQKVAVWHKFGWDGNIIESSMK